MIMRNWEDKISKLYNKIELCLVYALVFCAVTMFGSHIYRMAVEASFNLRQFVYLSIFGVVVYLVCIIVKLVKSGQEEESTGDDL